MMACARSVGVGNPSTSIVCESSLSFFLSFPCVFSSSSSRLVLNVQRGAMTCSISSDADIAFKKSLTAIDTSSCAAIRTRYQVDKLCVRLSFAITSTTTYDLYDFCQRRSYAYGDAAFAPCPVEAFFCRPKCNQYIECVARVHPLQVGLQGIASSCIIFHQVAYFQDAPVWCSHFVDEVLVIRFDYFSDAAYDVSYLVILLCIRCFGVHIGYVDQCFFRGVKCFGMALIYLPVKNW